jgi:hypothetical protein
VFEPAHGSAQSVAPGCRIGTGPARPSDQVAFDGRRSSSTWKRVGAAETLALLGEREGAHLGLLEVVGSGGDGGRISTKRRRGADGGGGLP